jgi:glycosyltransferase involved in cell wall biosynthesis
MTVAQGVRFEQFSVAVLADKLIDEAIQTQREIFVDCDGIFVESNWVKESICDDYGIDAAKIHVTGVGASLDMHVPIEEKRHNHNILFVGRDWNRKGGPLLLQAFEAVKREYPQAVLTIIGCRPGVSMEGVKVLGHLDKTDENQARIIEKAYSSATILCVPSVFDPFGIVFIESQFKGVVPVTFFGEGRAEAIKDGITGALVRERTADAIASVIVSLLGDAERVRQMSLEGQKLIRQHFTWDKVARRIVDVMEDDC